ncbi:helix-turn-helix domain-containing protein [Candidatus Desulfofervidus auxilii]|nr:helix-turn-helix domain-containing protein [Candidatus Desulfofervidus auxilii]
MMQNFSEIMTLEETAKYLRIGKSTLYKMAREGKIPAVKIGNQWRFKKEDIDKWFSKGQTFELR